MMASGVPFSLVGLGRRFRAMVLWVGLIVTGVKSKFLVNGAGSLALSSRPVEKPSTVRVMSPVKLGERAMRRSSLAAGPPAVVVGGKGGAGGFGWGGSSRGFASSGGGAREEGGRGSFCFLVRWSAGGFRGGGVGGGGLG